MLTDSDIKRLKPRNRPYELHDQGGLYLRIYPHGTCNWSCCYMLDRKKRRISLGTYPEMSLSQARTMCTHIKLQVCQGIDLATVSKLPKFLLDRIPHSEENIAEAVRISANKVREQALAISPPSVEERLSAVEQQLKHLTSLIATLVMKRDV